MTATIDDLTERLRRAGCVFAEEEAQVLIAAAAGPVELEAMAAERILGTPLEHVVGFAEFCGQRIMVDRGVFVPRQRTEFLVREAVGVASPGSVVVDLCCGSGAVGVAVAGTSGLPIELYASDIEPAAVGCARKNVEPVGGRVFEGDLFKPLPASLCGRIEVLVVNAPYVPTGAIDLMPREARLFEPLVTLDGGEDGLDLHRRIADVAIDWLAPGGHVLIETSIDQAPIVMRLFAGGGLAATTVRDEELDATLVVGRSPQAKG